MKTATYLKTTMFPAVVEARKVASGKLLYFKKMSENASAVAALAKGEAPRPGAKARASK